MSRRCCFLISSAWACRDCQIGARSGEGGRELFVIAIRQLEIPAYSITDNNPGLQGAELMRIRSNQIFSDFLQLVRIRDVLVGAHFP